MVVSVYMTVEFGKTIKVGALGNSEVVHSTSFYKSTCESVKLLTFGFFGCGPLRLPGYLLALGKAIADVVQLPRVFPNQDVCLHGSFPEMLSHYGLYKMSLLVSI